MNKIVLGERASLVRQLSELLTVDELCEELSSRDVADLDLAEKLKLDLVTPDSKDGLRDEITAEFVVSLSVLYDMVARQQTREALELIHELAPSKLLHPTAQLRIAELHP